MPQKPKWGAKEFPFKQFLKCYSCGSSIVGEEKFKARKDGTKNRHVYYHCSRQVDYNCKEPFVREEVIIEELSKLGHALITDMKLLEPGLAGAIDKYRKIMGSVKPDLTAQDAIDGYIKYVLHVGTVFEKTRLVRNLDMKLVLREGRLVRVG